MKKRLLIIFSALALAVVIGLWLLGPRQERFRYEGKSVLEWSLQLFGAVSAKDAATAESAFKRMAPDAVPILIRQLRTRDSFFGKAVGSVTRAIPGRVRPGMLRSYRPFETALARASAARALGAIGPEAAPAIPALNQALRDQNPQVSSEAARALACISSQSVPGLIEALHDGKPHVRYMAAYALGAIGEPATSAIPDLVVCLIDQDADVQSSSAGSLRKMGEPGLRAVLDTVEHGSTPSRATAARILPSFLPPIKEATSALSSLLTAGEPVLRLQAIESLTALHAADPRVISNYVRLLDDPDSAVRFASVNALSQTSWKAAQTAVPLLTDRLKDSSVIARINAANTLGKIGAPARPALPELEALTADKNETVRDAAEKAVAMIHSNDLKHPAPQ